MQGMAPASTGRWQDPDWSAVSSALAGSSSSLFPQPSALLQHCSICHLSPPAYQHDGARVCCFVPQNSDRARMVQDNRLPLARCQGSAHCFLAGMWTRNSLPEHGFGSQLRTQAAALLIRLSIRLLGELADGRVATLSPGTSAETENKGATRPVLMAPDCPVGVVHTSSRMANRF